MAHQGYALSHFSCEGTLDMIIYSIVLTLARLRFKSRVPIERGCECESIVIGNYNNWDVSKIMVNFRKVRRYCQDVGDLRKLQ